MSLLEDRYRLTLRLLLPHAYRAEREEEMVAAFLEGSAGQSDEDNARPRWSEIASVATLGVRVRLGGPGAPPRYLLWGRVVRQVAVLGLFYHAMMGVEGVAEFFQYGPGPRSNAMVLAGGLLWFAAYAVLLVRGWAGPAKVLAGVALALLLALTWHDPITLAFFLPLHALPVLALVAGFHRDTPSPRPRWAPAALPIVPGLLIWALTGSSAVWFPRQFNLPQWGLLWPWLDPVGLACLGLLGAMAVHFVRGAGRSPFQPLALAILAVPLLIARIPVLLTQGSDAITQTMTATQIGQCVALTLGAAALTALGARAVPASP
ncbi:hypothetical protein [Spongiactinospora rosea]|nr:hypothetical protein [Spongiactinospora rosea]